MSPQWAASSTARRAQTLKAGVHRAGHDGGVAGFELAGGGRAAAERRNPRGTDARDRGLAKRCRGLDAALAPQEVLAHRDLPQRRGPITRHRQAPNE